MGKYQITYSNRESGYTDRPAMHPIWRGIGFAMIILIPFMSYFAGLLLIAANKLHNWVPIPPDLVAPKGDPELYVKIILTVAISFVIYAVFMVITFVLNRMFAPSRYGPMDAPPIQRRVNRRYKRNR